MEICTCKDPYTSDIVHTDDEGCCMECGEIYTVVRHSVLREVEPVEWFDTNRKHYPVQTGCFDYFPKALMYISHVSWVGNEQHNAGQPLRWDRSKSQDDSDARGRHILGGEFDDDGLLEAGKAAWRANAVLEKILEAKGFKI